ncbi:MULTISPECIES: hypothetical protein [unclassified Lysobacter]|uniref:hypothetical protein n=1 Tax=unclassified Lysobacter TaxID=2635362 RepID=UPI001C245F87|nr:hypothetical protein [Lysobacter sp. MMG2]MBU8974938.1 hypothetical protein [Lysobacter sp. MMG2]
MSAPFFFGAADRHLFGLLHECDGAAASTDHALLVCAPLLQDGIRSHRALWALAEAVGQHGVPTLTFDWFGTGDSAGEDTALTLPGMLDDLQQASSELLRRSEVPRLHWLALRSAALPLFAHLERSAEPAEVVLWDPQLDGARLVREWRAQHQRQLHESGRYVNARHESDAGELLGFGVDDALLSALEGLDAAKLRLPSGTRVRMAVWEMDEELDRFAREQRANGVSVEAVLLDEGERPEWTVPSRFGGQVFPRRAVAQLAQRMTEQVPW